MLTTIDLANYFGPLRSYVATSSGGVRGTVTVLFKFGSTEALDCPALKLRFSAEQFAAFQQTVRDTPEFPGYDLADFDAADADARLKTVADHATPREQP